MNNSMDSRPFPKRQGTSAHLSGVVCAVYRWLPLALLMGVVGLGEAATVQLASNRPPVPLAAGSLEGYNLGNWMPVVEARDALNVLRPSLLRFPGGNVGDEQDLTEASFVPLKSNWTMLGKPPLLVQTRLFALKPDSHNQPADAAAAVRVTLAQGLPVRYWEIGNEPDLYAEHRGDPSWTPEKYCGAFRDQRAAILQVDPHALIAGPATSQPGPWVEQFIRLCGDVVDLLTWHEYPDNGTLSDEAALASVKRVSDDLAHYQQLLRDPQANPLGHTRTVQTGVTEYSLSWNTNRARHLSDQVAGLWAAEATLRLAEGGAQVATYFALQATGNHGLLDLSGIPRPSYYAMRELTHFQGQALLLQTDDDRLWVHAAQQDRTLTTILINTATEPVPVSLSLTGWQATGAKGFTAETVDQEAPLLRLNPSQLVLPPRSFVRVQFKALP
ncbi:hypothetical protein [Deinococcus sonorensis]|uniref:Uncharacterized protein n=2 Tax=Deinococcus sonorensis TaxID=309891 RepID=A0AAU7UHY8_9DEIO